MRIAVSAATALAFQASYQAGQLRECSQVWHLPSERVSIQYPPVTCITSRHPLLDLPHLRLGFCAGRIFPPSGDVVWFPAGEKHWHGATATTAMTHIAIAETLGGKAVEWMEQVTDEQYLAGQSRP
jgi:hypothetical protein